MRLARIGDKGSERPALVMEDGSTRDLSAVVGDIDASFLAGDGLEVVAAVDPDTLPPIEGRYGSCVARPGMVLCVGLNYEDHARETGAPIPAEPILFQKATNTVVGPFDDLPIPRASVKTDWEVELAVVVGSQARYLEDEAAGWAAIAGFAVSNDVSEREFQLERGGQWTKGKSCEGFNPLGPWLVTRDQLPDPLHLGMRTIVNGELMQDGNTRTMIFSPGHLVWYASQFMVLEPGDVVNTGTPPGVGMGMVPPRYVRVGDVVEISIEGLGSQRQVCVAA